MPDKELYSSDEQTIILPPRSEKHGSKRIRQQKKEKVELMERDEDEKGKESDKKVRFNFQLLFLRFIVLIFISMIILTVMYPNWLEHLTKS